MTTQLQVAIVGGGLAGLCTAISLCRRGAKVTIYDPRDVSRSASWAAAGMLAPAYEAATDAPEHVGMFELLCEARDHWDRWLAEAWGPDPSEIGFVAGPSVALGQTAGQAGVFRRLVKHGRAREMTPSELEDLSAIDSSAVAGGFWTLRDGQVDNRALLGWLREALLAQGVRFDPRQVSDAELALGALDADTVVDARGWRAPSCKPVKGTALAVSPHPGLPHCVVRWGRNYLVPKADRVVLGAHAMAGIVDTSVDTAIVAELVEEAAEVFPAVRECEVLEAWSGIRPQSRDGAPLLGWVSDGVYQVGGLYRDGVLLAPLLGQWAASQIMGEPPADLAATFDPARAANQT